VTQAAKNHIRIKAQIQHITNSISKSNMSSQSVQILVWTSRLTSGSQAQVLTPEPVNLFNRHQTTANTLL